MMAAVAMPVASGSVNEATAPVAASQPVVVLDFGGQYAQLIARRIRELGAYSEVVAHDVPASQIAAMNPVGMVLSGGPASVYEHDAPDIDPAMLHLGIPVLGICYGMHLIARHIGGTVAHTEVAEFGQARVVLENGGPLFTGVPVSSVCWMSHRDEVTALPEGSRVIARSTDAAIAAFEDAQRRLYGVQFHPEVAHTQHGDALLKNFVADIAGATLDWKPQGFIVGQIESIRERVGDQPIVCALSGGVDSAVAATLVHRAVGEQLTCVFVDHGLMRAGEAESVVTAMREQLGLNVVHVDASDRFLERLSGVEDPERKRRIIGEEFIRVFEEAARTNGEAKFLVQGTLYSDVIESGGDGRGPAASIKSHHNVGGLPELMGLELVEPLRTLFKDEVRRVGEALELPNDVLWRQPFPGPGLAIRIVGEVTRERVEIVRQADAILRDEIDKAGLTRELWQSFAVMPAVRCVGVQGDSRTYAYPIVVRAVTSDDAMTADWARLPYWLLQEISNRIVNEVSGVNRVVLDITSKPPATIEWE